MRRRKCRECRAAISSASKTGRCRTCLQEHMRSERIRRTCAVMEARAAGDTLATAGGKVGVSRERARQMVMSGQRRRRYALVHTLAALRPGHGARDTVDAVADLVDDLPPAIVTGADALASLCYIHEIAALAATPPRPTPPGEG